MNIETQILNTLTTAKSYVVDWDVDIISDKKNGIDVCCDEEKITLYTIWIELLQDYYEKKYLGVAYYGYRYISEQQALLLAARINAKDFKKQTGVEWNPSGDHNNDFNNDFSIS